MGRCECFRQTRPLHQGSHTAHILLFSSSCRHTTSSAMGSWSILACIESFSSGAWPPSPSTLQPSRPTQQQAVLTQSPRLSEQTKPCPHHPPDSQLAPIIQSVESNSVRLQWSQSAKPNRKITHYEVIHRCLEREDWGDGTTQVDENVIFTESNIVRDSWL